MKHPKNWIHDSDNNRNEFKIKQQQQMKYASIVNVRSLKVFTERIVRNMSFSMVSPSGYSTMPMNKIKTIKKK
jgi:reverse gyrase